MRTLEEEMRLHLDCGKEEQLQSGVQQTTPGTARRRFGNTTYIKEESHLAGAGNGSRTLAQDVRYGLPACQRKVSGLQHLAI